MFVPNTVAFSLALQAREGSFSCRDCRPCYNALSNLEVTWREEHRAPGREETSLEEHQDPGTTLTQENGSMGARRRGKGRRKVGRKKRRMRSKIRHRK
jgi:hypothetical protein